MTHDASYEWVSMNMFIFDIFFYAIACADTFSPFTEIVQRET